MTLVRIAGVAAAVAGLLACAPRPSVRHTMWPGGGVRSRQTFVGGMPDGAATTWHENGKPASHGRYARGRRQGRFRYWDESGALTKQVYYEAGRAVWVDTSAAPVGDPVPPRPSVASVAPHPATRRAVGGSLDVSLGPTIQRGISESYVPHDSSNGAIALTGTLRWRRLVAGASYEKLDLFQSWVGGFAGATIGADTAWLELAVEGGVHRFNNLGDTQRPATRFVSGDRNASLPYVGVRVGAVLDIVDPGGFTLHARLVGREDIGDDVLFHLRVQCNVFECSLPFEKRWDIGGESYGVLVGIGYGF